MSRETIWERAYRIFQHRLQHGLSGNKEGDWLKAREELEQEKNGYVIATIGGTRVRVKIIEIANK